MCIDGQFSKIGSHIMYLNVSTEGHTDELFIACIAIYKLFMHVPVFIFMMRIHVKQNYKYRYIATSISCYPVAKNFFFTHTLIMLYNVLQAE